MSGPGSSRRLSAPRSTSRARVPRAPASEPPGPAGKWTIGRENVVVDQAGGSIAYRFHAHDAHLVSPGAQTRAIPFFACSSTARFPAGRHGVDVDDHGNGLLRHSRLYQLAYANTTPSTNERWRSHSTNLAPRRTCSHVGDGRSQVEVIRVVVTIVFWVAVHVRDQGRDPLPGRART